jgi:hypothetical protein
MAAFAARLFVVMGEVAPAETRSRLFLNEEGEGADEFGPAFAWERKTGEGKEARVSCRIAGQIAIKK